MSVLRCTNYCWYILKHFEYGCVEVHSLTSCSIVEHPSHQLLMVCFEVACSTVNTFVFVV